MKSLALSDQELWTLKFSEISARFKSAQFVTSATPASAGRYGTARIATRAQCTASNHGSTITRYVLEFPALRQTSTDCGGGSSLQGFNRQPELNPL